MKQIFWQSGKSPGATLGVAGLLLAAAPFLWAADNPINVESLDTSGPAADTRMVPFEPVIDESTSQAQPADGIESQYQIQLLQQEVMELRGQVEELNNAIVRMRSTSEDRYLELDRRLQSLGQGTLQQPVMPIAGNDRESLAGAGTGNIDAGSAGSVFSEDEKSLYDTALELIRNRQYDLAVNQLQAVITQYPDGAYAPNAYYWIGEVHAAKPEPDYEAARQALSQVITFFPDHQKVPDAAFKLGKVYHLMGDCARATDLLTGVVESNRGKSVGKLAESYLRDKVSCE